MIILNFSMSIGNFMHLRRPEYQKMEGEQNTKFYHAIAKGKSMRSRLGRIKNAEGDWLEDEEEIARCGVNHYYNLYKSEEHILDADLLSVIPSLVTQEDNNMLTSLVALEELKGNVFSMSVHSAPGPDGFSGSFFHSAWEIIKMDLLSAVNYFMQGGVIPRSVNAMLLALIPKKDHPDNFSDFRPISLCNFLYKIFTKLLATRLSGLLPKLISMEQHGFVMGRSIGDSIALAQLMMNELNRKVEARNAILKLDMMKAFDRMEWDFIQEVLRRFGFSESLVNIISNCFQNQHISVNINGIRHGFFPTSRGLRQGDPLSPSLFILAEEVLSRGLKMKFQQGLIQSFHTGRGSILISHLIFADDTLIFLKGNQKSMKNLLQFVDKYEVSSGQKVNKQKSSLYCSSKMPLARKNKLSRIAQIPLKASPLTYLGCPIIRGRVKLIHFENLLNKFQSRLVGWYAKLLSIMGRVVLIQSVLSSIPVHLLSVLNLPKGIIARLNAIMASFFWFGQQWVNKRHWRSWKNISMPKGEGGLGIRKFEEVQQTFRMKHV